MFFELTTVSDNKILINPRMVSYVLFDADASHNTKIELVDSAVYVIDGPEAFKDINCSDG